MASNLSQPLRRPASPPMLATSIGGLGRRVALFCATFMPREIDNTINIIVLPHYSYNYANLFLPTAVIRKTLYSRALFFPSTSAIF